MDARASLQAGEAGPPPFERDHLPSTPNRESSRAARAPTSRDTSARARVACASEAARRPRRRRPAAGCRRTSARRFRWGSENRPSVSRSSAGARRAPLPHAAEGRRHAATRPTNRSPCNRIFIRWCHRELVALAPPHGLSGNAADEFSVVTRSGGVLVLLWVAVLIGRTGVGHVRSMGPSSSVRSFMSGASPSRRF